MSAVILFFFLLVSALPASSATTTETFNCANADDIDCDQVWDDDPSTGSGDLRLQGNRIDGETNGVVNDDPRLTNPLGSGTITATAVVGVAQPSSGTSLAGPALWMDAGTAETFCGCAITVNSSGQEFIRAAEIIAGALTQNSTAITYIAGNSATLQCEITSGDPTLLATYDPGGASEATATVECDGVTETTEAGIYFNQASGPTGSVFVDNITFVTPAVGRRRSSFVLP